MKKYVEKIDRWKTAKVLEFLGNFLKNHSGTVQNSDVFKPINDLLEDCDWEKKIKSVFPEKTVARMENFNGIMIGATNFIQNLDPAIMRRFTFKLGFDYLDNYGKTVFFSRMFHTRLNAAERRRLEAIENLTPGDFRTVRQSLYYLDEISNAARLSALEQESSMKKPPAKQENNNGKIGF